MKLATTAACRRRAKELGVTATQYRRWERGEVVPEVQEAVEAEAKKQEAA